MKKKALNELENTRELPELNNNLWKSSGNVIPDQRLNTCSLRSGTRYLLSPFLSNTALEVLASTMREEKEKASKLKNKINKTIFFLFLTSGKRFIMYIETRPCDTVEWIDTDQCNRRCMTLLLFNFQSQL